MLYTIVLTTLPHLGLSRDGRVVGGAVPRVGSPTPTSCCSSGCSSSATRSRSTRLGPRSLPPGAAGRHPVPDDLLRARRVRDLARVRLADPRPRRGLPLQRPHGAAPHVHDGRGAAAAARHARPGWPAGCSRPRWLFRTVRSLSRFVPAIVIVQRRDRGHALAGDRGPDAAVGGWCTSSPTPSCCCRRSSSGCRS